MSDSLLPPLVLPAAGETRRLGAVRGSAEGLAIHQAAAEHGRPVLAVVADVHRARELEAELRFFGSEAHTFPDRETLPYDLFSPHQDIVSDRLSALHRLPAMESGVLVVPARTLLHRLPPRDWVAGQAFVMDVGDRLDPDDFRRRLEAAGYRLVSQVMEHGEYAVRGNLVDLFPMGSEAPYRIDLFDEEIETIRTFDPESQRSDEKVEGLRLLPAREFPLDEAAVRRFREGWRLHFEGDPTRSPVYRDVSEGLAPAGLEYYLPLFFETTETLFDYLPEGALVVTDADVEVAADRFGEEVASRYESRRHDVERPLLDPGELFLRTEELFRRIKDHPHLRTGTFEEPERAGRLNLPTAAPPELPFNGRGQGGQALEGFVAGFPGRILFAAESSGRREALGDLLRGRGIHPRPVADWAAFLADDAPVAITVAPLERGLVLEAAGVAVVTESQLFGSHTIQERSRPGRQRDADAIIRDLAELQEGAAVVHEEHGVGRYTGLTRLDTGGVEAEFLTLEYSGGDRLYVPVSALDRLSRYTGAAAEDAPLHRLGSGQWEKAKRKAAERVRDVAAELLDIYARREAREGHAYPVDDQYAAFAASFPFEETEDQSEAIRAVVTDMESDKPMDRLVCGDVGFGKTEVALRAAFIAVQGGRQVAMLVPTTLLADQHYETFRDRFADWPVRIEVISRFQSQKEQKRIAEELAKGKVDIVIGTHKLIQGSIRYHDLGLVIIDEEHRFGVRQKERFKALRSEVDMLTLTATPIPRTLNLAFSGMRDLSVIATPPARRLPVKTFVSEWEDALIQEAVLREIRRGGQVYFVHNQVETIDRAARQVAELVPEASVRVAHGQMRELELERVMSDFYHQRFNVLVCSTIIETGIDVPSANTILIHRADHFGLAQLYQLRGRVGRSHHRAYAYLLIPPRGAMTADAIKRLEALESIEDLGTGFTLASHDLEIRGAGEILGDEQSGQMQEVGFTLYADMLERAVSALKSGREPDLEAPLDHGPEVDLQVPALIPEEYIPDVHTRLTLYKRIASAADEDGLRELQVEMIDRFGLLPDPVSNLFRITGLKLRAAALGIRKIELGDRGGRLIFDAEPAVDAGRIIELIQKEPQTYQLDGQDKLKLVADLPDLDARLAFVDDVLARLTGREAA
ncbi:transcription-repair coupling factor [Thiohalospira sp.]|uniref:transcription-repair coupling factor n=1 Tax=Thiohalospira sp. TaxID=3080549 RepID=UPI003980BAD9